MPTQPNRTGPKNCSKNKFLKGSSTEPERISFLATIHCHPVFVLGKTSEKSSEKSSEKILRLLAANPQMTIAELADEVGITSRGIEKNLKKLQVQNRLERVGGRKEGHWQVTEDGK